ncbi:hypothetical protein Scep_010642 [Stephania cephalantha]|uniref:Pentatricopeptide repeat-containing protein n=1 Tax=Stephania cephalantha TaxID=152367 RepID=A0AAP0JVF4_9MAGN
MTDLQMIKSMHTFVVKKGLRFENDALVLGTAMVDAYCKCSDIETASLLFNRIKKPSTATWNAMISGYTLNHCVHQSMQLFLAMLVGDVPSDSITMVILFQSCGELGSLNLGRMIHGFCLSKGFSSHLTVNNAMIDMYMRCGCRRSSQLLFNLMPYKNVVSWNTMLYGYVKVNDFAMALKLFHEMQLENQQKPDYVTMIPVIQAYAANTVNHGGPMVHCLVLKLGLQSEILVANSLLDAYAKNGLIDRAWSLFDQMGWLRDQTSWNAMIAGCGMNGQGKKACELLLQMEENGYKPNSITFISLLSSCSHSGLIDEGCRYFNMMITQFKIQPSLEHWTCIIDMFGRAGRLEEAYLLIKNEIGFGSGGLYDCAAIWASLLSACRTNMNVDIGELASQHLLKLAPHNCGHYSLLSNLYAFGKRWDDAANMRRVFEDGRLMKKPGLSLVKV